jgi:translation initiation factor 3 subunit F
MISHLVDLLINTAKSSNSTSTQPLSDLELIERAIIDVSDMLDRVLAYVRDVLSGQKRGDPAVGRYLMDTLGPSTEGLEKGGFNSSLQVNSRYQIYLRVTDMVFQDTLMLSYLANLVRLQAEVSSRLALAAAT